MAEDRGWFRRAVERPLDWARGMEARHGSAGGAAFRQLRDTSERWTPSPWTSALGPLGAGAGWAGTIAGNLGWGGSSAGGGQQVPQEPLPGGWDQGRGRVPDPWETVRQPDFGGGSAARQVDVVGMLAGAADSLNRGYQQQLDELRQLYQFAETPDEKAQLQWLLRDLEAETDAARTIIGNVYDDAIAGAGQREAGMREAAVAEGEAAGNIHREAGERAAAAIQDVAGRYEGGGLGVGAAPVSGDATDWLAVMEQAGASAEGLSRNLGNIAADDIAHLGATMRAEQAAQIGDAQRHAMGMAVQLRSEHNRRVQERTHAERMAYAQQAGQIGSQAMAHQADLQSQAARLALDVAGMDDAAQARQFDWHKFMADREYAAHLENAMGGQAGGPPPAGSVASRLWWMDRIAENPQLGQMDPAEAARWSPDLAAIIQQGLHTQQPY